MVAPQLPSKAEYYKKVDISRMRWFQRLKFCQIDIGNICFIGNKLTYLKFGQNRWLCAFQGLTIGFKL